MKAKGKVVTIVEAADKSGGMTLEELMQVITEVRAAGFNNIARVRVGFSGQIQEVHFTKEGT